MNNYQLICVIVNEGCGSKVIKYLKQSQVTGATIFLGHGTVRKKLLEFLDLHDVRKEIVVSIAKDEFVNDAIDLISDKMKLHKPNKGILFTSDVLTFLGNKHYVCEITNERNKDHTMYHAIYVIVDKGRAEDVMTSARNAGAKGGTIINARGAGVHETSKVFNIEIEPEKEMVLILAIREQSQSIVEKITKDLEIEKPGNGIIFVQDVSKTVGINE